jgi:hypothetical protein
MRPASPQPVSCSPWTGAQGRRLGIELPLLPPTEHGKPGTTQPARGRIRRSRPPAGRSRCTRTMIMAPRPAGWEPAAARPGGGRPRARGRAWGQRQELTPPWRRTKRQPGALRGPQTRRPPGSGDVPYGRSQSHEMQRVRCAGQVENPRDDRQDPHDRQDDGQRPPAGRTGRPACSMHLDSPAPFCEISWDAFGGQRTWAAARHGGSRRSGGLGLLAACSPGGGAPEAGATSAHIHRAGADAGVSRAGLTTPWRRWPRCGSTPGSHGGGRSLWFRLPTHF